MTVPTTHHNSDTPNWANNGSGDPGVESELVNLGEAAQALLERTNFRIGLMFETERAEWLPRHPELTTALDTLQASVLGGGKRIRPLLAFHGFVAAGGSPDDDRIVDLACALELLHAFALIHDDIMDNSDLRRHQPTVHEQYRNHHERLGWAGEARRNAEAFAMLLGDLAFAFSIRFESELPLAVRQRLDRIRTELHVGQYLDLLSAATRSRDPQTARDIAFYKTAKYTVEGPLVLGATLAGNETVVKAFTTYGDAVGEAFQHRDDLLGVFGAPETTGKPRYDDLRAGKCTLLLHLTRLRAKGRPDIPMELVGTDELSDQAAAVVAEFMTECGSVAEMEQRIAVLIDDAIAALDTVDIPEASRAELTRLAYLAGNRTT